MIEPRPGGTLYARKMVWKELNLFSKRQKKARGEAPDVYTYDDLPKPLRVQIIYIWGDIFGTHPDYHLIPESTYKYIVESLRREFGVFELASQYIREVYKSYEGELHNFFLQEKNIEKAIDAIELSFKVIDGTGKIYGPLQVKKVNDAIAELNYRFKEHGVGYQFTSGEIVRIDSEYIHAEIVKPGLNLLNQKHYAGAQQEFLKAHEHYRKGNAKEALNECLKAFESTMKAICDKRNWSYNKKAIGKSLIQVCFNKGLIPQFWQNHYSSLRKLLKSSLPPVRNELSAHGQGTNPVTVPNHLVAYMLHMTASAIVFLAEAEKNLS